MTMIDDFSRFTIVYLLKRKSEAEEKIKEYINLVQNQIGRKPKIIRADGGGKYSGSSLQQFLRDNGIILQQTVPYSPQQNGTAERKNRCLTEMMRCLLAESGLSKKYWGEAVMTTNYLQNRLPSTPISRTPFEIWTGKPPCYKDMHIFGTEALVSFLKRSARNATSKLCS